MLKILLAVAAFACVPAPSAGENARPAMVAARAALAAFAQKEVEGFAAVRRPWTFRFPADHAVHPEHRTESWRFSGVLAAANGRRFGFHLIFLRVGIVPPAVALGPSTWAARDVYWTELRLTDVAASRHHDFEKHERAAAGLSGAQSSPPRVWVHDWSIEAHDAERFRLQGAEAHAGIDLSLAAAKPPAGRTADAFHGYVLTRLRAKGALRIDGRTHEVEGIAWLDRAWGAVPLPVGAVVWDRFLVQLDDEREIMGVRLRRRDGSGVPSATGLLVRRDGATRLLEGADLAIDRTERGWRLRILDENVDLHIGPYVGHSGPSSVTGTQPGHAYVESATDVAAAR